MADWRCLLGALLLPPMTATADFSEALDKLWNYGKPAESEARFRTELATYPPGSREALEIATQIARTHSLRRQFTDADKTLDEVAPALATAPARVRVRYLLERGRTRNSGGEREAAVALFKDALSASAADTLPGADFYRVDALHMLGIASPAGEQLAWNLKALAAAEASAEARTRNWAAALDNNIGWTYFERNDPATALVYWQKALPLREAMGNPSTIRIAKWTIARGYRALGRLDDAEEIQLALVTETESASEPDGYVYEELAELAYARGNAAAAAPWAAKAHALLKDDAHMKANETARLARLASLAEGKAP
ncbi:MAG: hypothetical protein IT518_13755 [Burkholderiales bacterium]|nr:hypothetical protein [Burkholderiales bacterium]